MNLHLNQLTICVNSGQTYLCRILQAGPSVLWNLTILCYPCITSNHIDAMKIEEPRKHSNLHQFATIYMLSLLIAVGCNHHSTGSTISCPGDLEAGQRCRTECQANGASHRPWVFSALFSDLQCYTMDQIVLPKNDDLSKLA